MHPLEVSSQGVPIWRDMETKEAFLQSCRSSRMVPRDVLRTFGNAPKKLPAYLALVTQLLVQQVGSLVAVPQVASHPVLAVRDGGTERAPEGRPRCLPVCLALVRVPTGEEVESLAADVAAERLVPLLLALLVLAAHVVREGEYGREDNRADLIYGRIVLLKEYGNVWNTWTGRKVKMNPTWHLR